MLKRLFDLVTASLGLVVLCPVLLGIGLVVKLTSQGPVFYRGRRIGRYGEPFGMFKFRTMIVDAEAVGGTSTGKNDPRVTKTGRMLRRYKLDELPQLLNVLRGEMSIVGPRPEVEEYTRLYDDDEQVILSVRPGITDYASIQFRDLAEVLGSEDADRVYAETVRPIKNRLRMKYVVQQRFAEDLRIIALTVLSLARR